MELISREVAIEEFEDMVTSVSVYGESAEARYATNARIRFIEKLNSIPTVDAVPLDKLCEWLSESSINIPCTSCKNFVNEYCTAIGDKNRPCPNSADDWRRAITEWMEEQDAAD